MIKVFITCSGGGVAQSVIDSLRLATKKYFIVTNDLTSFNYGSSAVDRIVKLPSIKSDGYIDLLLEACIELNVDIIIPGSDVELTMLAESRELFEKNGVAVLVAERAFVSLCRDKLEWSRMLNEKSFAVVPSYSVSELLHQQNINSNISFPAIAKPRGGSASSLLKIINNFEDLQDLSDEHVVQPFLFPKSNSPSYRMLKEAVSTNRTIQVEEVSVQLLFDKKGNLKHKFASINKLKNGVPIEIVPTDDPDIWRAADSLLEALSDHHVTGPVNIQGRITDNGTIFFEMNPRFTGITATRALLGFNEVDFLVRSWLSVKEPEMRINLNKTGVRQVACRAKNFERKKLIVVVSGANSWLGKNLIRELLQDSSVGKILGLVREKSLSMTSVELSSEKVEILAVDELTIDSCFGQADVFINLASARPPRGNRSVLESFEYQNALLMAAGKYGVSSVVNISSQSVYNPESMKPWSEGDCEINYLEPYGLLKYSIEQQVAMLARLNDTVSSVSLRLGRLVGGFSGARSDEFFHKVVRKILSGEDVKLSNKEHQNNLLSLNDAISAIKFFIMLKNIKFNGDTFNINSVTVTTDNYLKLVNRLTFRNDLSSDNGESVTSKLEERSMLNLERVLSLGWSPSDDLQSIIIGLIDFYKKG